MDNVRELYESVNALSIDIFCADTHSTTTAHSFSERIWLLLLAFWLVDWLLRWYLNHDAGRYAQNVNNLQDRKKYTQNYTHHLRCIKGIFDPLANHT